MTFNFLIQSINVDSTGVLSFTVTQICSNVMYTVQMSTFTLGDFFLLLLKSTAATTSTTMKKSKFENLL